MKDKKILYVGSKISDVPYSEKLLSLLDINSEFRIIPLTFEQWQFQRTSFKDTDKVLFIGHVDPIVPLVKNMDIKYKEYGVCYGWLGNKAALVCDKTPVKDRKTYKEFLEKLREETDLSGEDLEKKEKDLLTILSMAAFALLVPFGIFAVGTKLVKDYFYNENQLKKQQYIYGIFHLYKHHLKEFMDI